MDGISASPGSSNESVSHSLNLKSAQLSQERYAAELSSSPSLQDLPSLDPLSNSPPGSSSRVGSSNAPYSEASNQLISAHQQDISCAELDRKLFSSSSPGSEQIPEPTEATTFFTRIAPERELAASLDILTSCDLSIHLFNAFALKCRVGARFDNPRRNPDLGGQRIVPRQKPFKNVPSKAEPSSAAEDNEITYEQVGDHGWHPPRVWTSWPMQAEEVPREWARSEWDDSPLLGWDGRFERSSEVLQECLTARILNAAKIRFRGREWATQEREPHLRPFERKERENVRESSTWYGARSQQSVVLVGESGEEEEEVEHELVEMADDETTSKILRPSVQHLVAKLDGLLLGLYHARASYATVKSTRSYGEAEEETEAESEPVSRTAKQSRKRRRLIQESTKDPQAQNLQDKDSGGVCSASDYSINTRSRKRQRTGSVSRPSSRHAKSKSRETSQPPSRDSAKLVRPSYKATFAPLDWSTILGVAALQGWSCSVVHKAAQRCGGLLDESMQFQVLDENERRETGVDVDILPVSSKKGREKKVKGSGEGKDDGHRHNEQDPSTEDESSSDMGKAGDREAMFGGVHVDGFMQPIQGKKWWGKIMESRDASLPKGPKGRPRKYVNEYRPKRPRGRPRKKTV